MTSTELRAQIMEIVYSIGLIQASQDKKEVTLTEAQQKCIEDAQKILVQGFLFP